MALVHRLRVFADATGAFGDVATVIVDEGRRIPDLARRALTRQLGTGETVFVNDLSTADISFMHSHGEIDFAGVAAVGTAWFLARLSGEPLLRMRGRGGAITVSQEGDVTWVRASLATMPAWQHQQLDEADDVDRITVAETADWQHTMVWAWLDEARGLVRARTFAPDWEIPEAQGNGSGSLMLAAMLGRSVEIRHGEGAVIFARPGSSGDADLGGRLLQLESVEV